jgi:hypothetical protein
MSPPAEDASGYSAFKPLRLLHLGHAHGESVSLWITRGHTGIGDGPLNRESPPVISAQARCVMSNEEIVVDGDAEWRLQQAQALLDLF